jgi:phosphonate transport system substrate-binding protein
MPQAGSTTTLRFGLSRHHGGAELSARAARFAAALGAATGAPTRVVMTADYDRLLEGLRVGGVDVAWMPPLLLAHAAEMGALLAALCRRGGALAYRSAILVRREAQWRSAADVAGARAAWGDPASASGHLAPRQHLVARGGPPRRLFAGERCFGSAREAAAAVARGDADLCACYVGAASDDPERALADAQRVLGETASALQVLEVTAPLPADGMVLAAPLDGWRQAALRDALLALHERPAGARAIADLLEAERLAPVSDEARRAIEALAESSRSR